MERPDSGDVDRTVDPGGGDAVHYFDSTGVAGDRVGGGGESITSLGDLASYEIAEGLFFRPVFAENLCLNFVTFPSHSGFPTHVHPEEQISVVVEGEMEFTVGQIRRRVHPGDVIICPANVPHSGTTFESGCRLIDVFSPPRTGIQDVIAEADPVRGAGSDSWWYRPL